MSNVSAPSGPRRVRFGVFEFDLATGDLFDGRRTIRLQEQPRQVLSALVGRPGELVTRDDLRTLLWPGDTFVDFDTGLNVIVNKIRRALGDSATSPRFVETLSRRGYRFIAPVAPLGNGEATHAEGPTAPERTHPQASGRAETAVRRIAMAPRAWLRVLEGVAAVSGSFAEPQPGAIAGQIGVEAARPRARFRGPLWMPAALVASATALVIAVGTGVILRSRQDTSTAPGPTLSRLTFSDGVQTQPAWSPDGQFVAYASDQSGNQDIWVQPISGGRPVRITSDPADDSAPAWAPDGQHIAFRSERDGGGIYLVRALGGEERRVAGIGHRPRWSPDGTRLLCSSETGQQNEHAEKHIYVVTVDGGPPTEVLRSFAKGLIKSPSVAWHPDGERISVWGEHRTLGPGFWTARLPDGDPVLSPESVGPIKQNYWFWWFMDVVWAPSGDALYFTGPGPRGHVLRNVFRVDIDPGTLRWITGPVQLTNGPGPDAAVALSSDGRRLLFAGLSEERRLWSFPLDADGRVDQAAGQPLTPPGVEPLLFDVDQAGRRLLLVRGVTGDRQQRPPEIRELDLITEVERVLSGNVGPWTELPQEPRWSPDGRQIAYVRWKDRDAQGNPRGPTLQQMVLLDAETGDERVISDIDGEKIFVVWDFTPDGSAVVVAAGPPKEHSWTPMLYPLGKETTARPRRIAGTPAGAELWHARLSPTGRWLAISAVPQSLESSTLYVGDLLDRERFVQVTDGRAFDGRPRWSAGGTLLYFTSNRGSPGNVFNLWAIRMDPAGGQPLGSPFQVTTFRNPELPRPEEFGDFRIAGGRIIVPLRKTSGSIWMLENIR